MDTQDEPTPSAASGRAPGRGCSTVERPLDLVYRLGIVYWEADPERRRYSFVSPNAEALLGVPAADWGEQADFWREQLHPEDRGWTPEYCAERIAAGREFQVDYRMLRSDGSTVWVRDVVRPIPGVGGHHGTIYGLTQEVTDRIRAEGEVAHERSLLQALLETIPDLIYFKDRESRFIRINRAQAAILGLESPDQAVGRTDGEFFPEDLAAAYQADERRVLEGETVVNKLEPLRTADGSRRWLLTTKVPVVDPEGRIVGLSGISRDVTQQRLAEEQLSHVLTGVRCLLWSADVYEDPAAPSGLEWDLFVTNETAAEQFFPLRKRPGQRFSDAWYDSKLPEDKERIARIGNEAIRAAAPGYTHEFRIRLADGRVRWLYEDARIEALGSGRWRVVGVCTDVTKRKQAEEAHALSEARLEEAQRIARLGNWEVDLASNSLYWSDQAYRIFGFDPEEVRASRTLFMSLIHPADRARVGRAIQAAIHYGHPYQVEHRICRRNGEERWVQERGELRHDASGRPEKFVGTVLDITARKQVEEALRVREERYRTLIEALPQRVFFKNRDSVFVSVNPRFAADLGVGPSEVVGKTDHDFFPPELAYKYRADDRRVMDTGRAETLEERNVLQGEERFVEVVKAPVFSDAGEVVGVLGLFTDISERKRAQLALEESERRLRAQNQMFEDLTRSKTLWAGELSAGMREIAEAASLTLQVDRAAIWLFNEDRTGLRCANLYERELRRHSGGLAVLASDYPLYFAALERGRVIDAHEAQHDPRTREFTSAYLEPLGVTAMLDAPIRVGGELRGVLCLEHTGSPRRWSLEEINFAGSAADLVALAIQSHERRQAEEKLQTFAAQLEQTNRELQDFAYVASHDLQEPLRKILMFGDRLKVKCGDQLNDAGNDYLERMQGAASRMQTLINDLLAFSRITTRAQPLAPTDLGRIAREVLTDLEAAVEQSGASVELEPLPTVEADPTQMRQLLQNLIGNALKFRQEGTAPRVRISCRPRVDPGHGESDGLQIRIEDNGIGFDEKYLSRIFTPFQRLHGRHEYAGTGIGLAICRKIVERHGWEITATSRPGEGATFIITVPQREKYQENC